jgi:hypothetical protein
VALAGSKALSFVSGPGHVLGILLGARYLVICVTKALYHSMC